MNSDNASKWLSLVANIAILMGLGLVAYELNQNSQLARTSLIHEGNALENQVWSNLLGEAPVDVIAKAVECPETMTYADFMAMPATRVLHQIPSGNPLRPWRRKRKEIIKPSAPIIGYTRNSKNRFQKSLSQITSDKKTGMIILNGRNGMVSGMRATRPKAAPTQSDMRYGAGVSSPTPNSLHLTDSK